MFIKPFLALNTHASDIVYNIIFQFPYFETNTRNKIQLIQVLLMKCMIMIYIKRKVKAKRIYYFHALCFYKEINFSNNTLVQVHKIPFRHPLLFKYLLRKFQWPISWRDLILNKSGFLRFPVKWFARKFPQLSGYELVYYIAILLSYVLSNWPNSNIIVGFIFPSS